ncbi:MAG: 3-phosphoshikimate 1-carboxyvinyltransferase [archaeon]|nr:3-phosphoshikimate 1-carboxyvinyltransferase [archaeon]
MREIHPSRVDCDFTAPASKAHTLRALFIAALARGKSRIVNALDADDQKRAATALSMLGAKIKFDGKNFEVEGTGGKLIAPKEKLFVGNSGVTARFLAPICGLAQGDSTIDGDERMRKRPISDLLDSLAKVGLDAKCDGCPPVRVRGKTFIGGETTVLGSKSSQYLSAMLLAAPLCEKGILVRVEGELKSAPYVGITLECMRKFGAEVVSHDGKEFFVRGKQGYKAAEFVVEGDYSSASYFFAAAAITKGRARVKNLNPHSIQADKFFLDCLARMGCKIYYGKDFAEVRGAKLKGIDVDMGNAPDVVPTLAVVAAFAFGKTRITNVAHLAIKESNRLESVASNLRACGVDAKAGDDFLEIVGGGAHGAEIETFSDHRIAMAFSAMGLAVPGIFIKNPEVVSKSFPGFFDELSKAYSKGEEGSPANIALIGFRGTGKTAIGKILAKRLNMKFVDTDKEVVRLAGKSVAQIFAQQGEPTFRELEKEVVDRASGMENTLISCGGGVVLFKENIENLKRNSTVILLESDAKSIYARIKGNRKRPALTDKKGIDEVRHLLAQREGLYVGAADFFVDTSNDSLNGCAQKIIDMLYKRGLI